MLGGLFPAFAAAVQQRPDRPFGDILGWLIVFFVVVWPILRGLLDNAANQRKKFEEQQRRASRNRGGRPAEKRSRLDEFVEEMITGQRAKVDAGDARADAFDPGTTETATTVLEPAPTPPPRPARRREPSRPPEPEPASRRDFSTASIGSDPFDESLLETDLVADEALAEVPSEDAVETEVSYAEAIGGLDQTIDLMPTPELDRASALERIQRRRTPWQAAYVLKEVLGPPAALQPPSQAGLR
ncbi:MAG: hypothetical protein AAGB93_06795 [Planctomycetota bacterium]